MEWKRGDGDLNYLLSTQSGSEPNQFLSKAQSPPIQSSSEAHSQHAMIIGKVEDAERCQVIYVQCNKKSDPANSKRCFFMFQELAYMNPTNLPLFNRFVFMFLCLHMNPVRGQIIKLGNGLHKCFLLVRIERCPRFFGGLWPILHSVLKMKAQDRS